MALQISEKFIADAARMHDCILAAKHITIVAHTHPDGDAAGSTCALLGYLTEVAGKDAAVILPDEPADTIAFIFKELPQDRFFAYSSRTAEAEARIAETDLLFCLDCNGFHRTGDMEQTLEGRECTKILIDHHLNPERDSFNLVFSETEISSASELLFYVLLQMPEIAGDAARLTKGSAASLMAGMTTDTNNFANSVWPTTLQMASSLLAAGTDRNHILSELYNQYRENRIRLMGRLLADVLRITDDGAAYMVLDKKTREQYDIREGETEGFVNIPLSIASVRMSIFLKEEEDHFRVSIRSKEGTSANRCATQYFNGGGHELASGGRLYKSPGIETAAEAEEYIVRSTSEFFCNNK